MSKTIVVLLILLIVIKLVRIGVNVKKVTKEDTIKFYEQKLKSARESRLSDGTAVLAFIAYLAIECAVIYYAIQSIFQFIK